MCYHELCQRFLLWTSIICYLGSFHQCQTQASGLHGGWRFAARPQNSITCTGEKIVLKYGSHSVFSESSCCKTST